STTTMGSWIDGLHSIIRLCTVFDSAPLPRRATGYRRTNMNFFQSAIARLVRQSAGSLSNVKTTDTCIRFPCVQLDSTIKASGQIQGVSPAQPKFKASVP